MLDKILKSKLGISILEAFYERPERDFYVRELARFLSAPVSSVAKQLDVFGQIGLLESRLRGGVKYYRLDENSPIALEMASLFRKTAGLVSEIRKRLAGVSGVELAYLEGRVDGDWPFNRPLKLVVVGGVPAAVKASAEEASGVVGRAIEVRAYSPDEYRRLPDDAVAGVHTVLIG